MSLEKKNPEDILSVESTTEDIENIDANDDDERYVLTPWGCLYATLREYGIDLSHITGRVGEHIVEDFMETMVRAGHVLKAEEEK